MLEPNNTIKPKRLLTDMRKHHNDDSRYYSQYEIRNNIQTRARSGEVCLDTWLPAMCFWF